MANPFKEAEKAKKTAEEVFAKGGVSEDMPTTVIGDVVGMGMLEMLVKTGLFKSNGEARRLVQQGGVFVNDEKGPDHSKTFAVAVFIGEAKYGEGIGRSKKHAEMQAAYNAILKLRGVECI